MIFPKVLRFLKETGAWCPLLVFSHFFYPGVIKYPIFYLKFNLLKKVLNLILSKKLVLLENMFHENFFASEKTWKKGISWQMRTLLGRYIESAILNFFYFKIHVQRSQCLRKHLKPSNLYQKIQICRAVLFVGSEELQPLKKRSLLASIICIILRIRILWIYQSDALKGN